MIKSSQRGILDGPLLPAIIRYTIPIILSTVLQLLFNAADLVIVGRFCGSLSVAAVGATGTITALLVNMFVGLSVGAGVAVAQAIGAGDSEGVHKSVHTSIPLSIIFGIILSVAGFFLCDKFLTLVDTPEDVLPLSTIYMKIYFSGVIFVMLYNFAAAILRAAGDTKSPLTALVIAGVINVALNVFFVTVLHMNVAGVALATIISQAVSAILVVITLIRRDDACHLSFKAFHIYREQFFTISKIGVPAGIQSSLFNISNVLIQSSINSFGPVFLSGSSASGNIEGFVSVLMLSFHQTALNFTGQNLGAKQFARIKKILIYCLISVAVSTAAAGAVTYIFGEQLLGIYITDSPDAISYGMIRLAFIALPFWIGGLHEVASGALRGLGSSLAPMLISIVGVCLFRIIWVFTVFRIIHTPECLFSSYPITWFITAATEIIMFFIILKKKEQTTLNV